MNEIANRIVKSTYDKNELRHWGVKGMKWGKTDPKKEQINNGNSSNQNEAVLNLKKDLEKQGPKIKEYENKKIVDRLNDLDRKQKNQEKFDKELAKYGIKVKGPNDMDDGPMDKNEAKALAESIAKFKEANKSLPEKVQDKLEKLFPKVFSETTTYTTYSDLEKKDKIQGPKKPKKSLLGETVTTTSPSASDRAKEKPIQGPAKPKKKTLAERFPSIFSETTTFDSSPSTKKKK